MVYNLITLFDANETQFTSGGLGGLTEAFSCLVTEERNGAFDLEMEYPVTGKRYSDIQLRRIIFCQPNPFDNPQAFRISQITKPLNGKIKIYANHISYDLNGYAVEPFNAVGIGETLRQLKSHSVVTTCPFNFSADPDIAGSGEYHVYHPQSIRSTLGGSSGSVLDTWHGEYKWDNFNVTLMKSRGANRNVSIRYGKNLTDLKQEETFERAYTHVYPFYYNAEYNELRESNPRIIQVPGTEGFTYKRVLALDLTDKFSDGEPHEDYVAEVAEKYIQDNEIGKPKVSLDVSFVSLEQSKEYETLALLYQVRLCDEVNIYYPKLNVNATSKCIKTVYDVLKKRYKKITLGEAKSNLSSTIASQSTAINNSPSQVNVQQISQKISNYESKLITGGYGGYVVLRNSAGTSEDQPDEILIMDSPDVRTAVNVWRWNRNGLGFSSNGYNGDYNLAITSDGKIVADFIKAGVIDGSLIEADSIDSASIKAGVITVDHLAQAYKDSVTNQINSSSQAVEQAFTAANGELRSEISSMKTTIENNKTQTETQFTSIAQDMKEIVLSASERFTGGENHILNSSGLNGLSDDWTRSGNVEAISGTDDAAKTSAGSLFRLIGTATETSKLSQTISVISGKEYTLTFKAKRKSSFNAYFNIDNGGSIIPITSYTTSWETYASTFTASSEEVVIEIGSTGDAFLVADLMLVEGDQRSNWSPAPNEIYTTNVKIDRKGIHITNSQSSTETLIDNTQFAIINRINNEKVLSVNRELTTLKKTQIEDDLVLGKSKWYVITGEDPGIDLSIFD